MSEQAAFDRAATETRKRGASGNANMLEAMTLLGSALLESDLALAACEAREARLLWVLRDLHQVAEAATAYTRTTHAEQVNALAQSADALLSAPRDSAALRAFGEKCAEAGQKDSFDEISAMDAGVPRKQQDAAAIVARILSGGQS